MCASARPRSRRAVPPPPPPRSCDLLGNALAGEFGRLFHPTAATVPERCHVPRHVSPVGTSVERHRSPQLGPDVVLHRLKVPIHLVLTPPRANCDGIGTCIGAHRKVPLAGLRFEHPRRAQPLAESDCPSHRRVETTIRLLHWHALPCTSACSAKNSRNRRNRRRKVTSARERRYPIGFDRSTSSPSAASAALSSSSIASASALRRPSRARQLMRAPGSAGAA